MAVGRAEARAVGYGATATIQSQVGRASAKAVGFPALASRQSVSAADVPDSLRLEILDKYGAQLTNDFLPRRNLAFSVEHNGAGSISFETDIDSVTTPAQVTVAAGANLVANPSGAGGSRAGWWPKDWDVNSHFDTGIGAWVAGSSCSVAWTGAQNASGSGGALAITRLSTTGTALASDNSRKMAVTPGQVVTAHYAVKSDTVARTALMALEFFDSAGASLSNALGGNTLTTTSGWTTITHSATAPAGAASVQVVPEISSAAAGEVHYIDDVIYDGFSPIPITQSVASPGTSPPAATSIKVQSGPSAPVSPGYYDMSYDPVLPGAGPLRVRVSLDAYVQGSDGQSQINFYRGDGTTDSGGAPPSGHGDSLGMQVVHYNDGWVHVTADFDTTAAFPYIQLRATSQSPSSSDVAVYLTNYNVQVLTTSISGGTTALDSPLFAPDNLVRVHFGTLPAWPYGVAEAFVTAAPPSKDDTGQEVLPLRCPGTLEVLDFGVIWPPDGATGDTREFSYTAGQTGPSWVPEEWDKPNAYLVKNSFRWKRGRWPKNWPEGKSKWVWSSSPERKSPVGVRKFVGSFTLSAKHDVHFYVAGDDNLRLYLNGALLKTKRRGGWKRTASFVRTLKAGAYTVAAEVANLAGTDNKSGFIIAVAQLNSNGSRHSWLLRSNEDTILVRKSGGYFAQVPLPPDGWYPPAVLWQHVQEAANRGARFHPGITLTYSNTHDSYGSAWTAKGKSEYEIGMSGLALVDDIVSFGNDVAMLPGLRLSSWRQRGFDLQGRVVLSGAKESHYSTRSWGRVRTVGLVKHESGWAASDRSGGSPYGRRELTISGGGVDGDAQADVFAQQALDTAASPEETVEVVVSTDDVRSGAPMPFRDFNVADIITMEVGRKMVPVKVMTISGAEDDSKRVEFTIAGYPV